MNIKDIENLFKTKEVFYKEVDFNIKYFLINKRKISIYIFIYGKLGPVDYITKLKNCSISYLEDSIMIDFELNYILKIIRKIKIKLLKNVSKMS